MAGPWAPVQVARFSPCGPLLRASAQVLRVGLEHGVPGNRADADFGAKRVVGGQDGGLIGGAQGSVRRDGGGAGGRDLLRDLPGQGGGRPFDGPGGGCNGRGGRGLGRRSDEGTHSEPGGESKNGTHGHTS